MIKQKTRLRLKRVTGKIKECMQDTFLIYHDTLFMSTENFNEHILVDKIKL